jgi:hypothetical protein
VGVLAKLAELHGAVHEWDALVLKKPKKRSKKTQKELNKAMSGPMKN